MSSASRPAPTRYSTCLEAAVIQTSNASTPASNTPRTAVSQTMPFPAGSM